jgi:hypothetical protein
MAIAGQIIKLDGSKIHFSGIKIVLEHYVILKQDHVKIFA